MYLALFDRRNICTSSGRTSNDRTYCMVCLTLVRFIIFCINAYTTNVQKLRKKNHEHNSFLIFLQFIFMLLCPNAHIVFAVLNICLFCFVCLSLPSRSANRLVWALLVFIETETFIAIGNVFFVTSLFFQLLLLLLLFFKCIFE